MTIPSVAAGAYANVARLADPSAGLGKAAGAASEAANGPSFSAMLKEALNLVSESGYKSDAQTQSITAGEGANGPSFGAMLKDALNSVAESGHKSDAQTQSMIAGKADMVDVVTAVSETEVAVETMVAVRNKVIEAYQSIMSMPI
jgi:flagellar hook-basal body complex protein FliE